MVNGINRNIVECKLFNIIQHILKSLIVLIETLWNVNVELSDFHAINRFGINRNIVECKYCILLGLCYHPVVLIETLWNVNKELLKTGKVVKGINRNIVECKSAPDHC